MFSCCSAYGGEFDACPRNSGICAVWVARRLDGRRGIARFTLRHLHAAGMTRRACQWEFDRELIDMLLKNIFRLYYSVVLIIPLTAGGTRVSAYGAAMPRRMAMRRGGTERERGVFRAKCKRKRVSATPSERHQKVAEERVRGAEPGEAQLHEAQASRTWIHAAFHPCGTRAVFAATHVAARAAVKIHIAHSVISMIL